MEVHHIVPKSEGGQDTAENAIALCFDCHAAAGHYNPKHPRGTKFSTTELRRHREAWHAIVAKGAVRSPGTAGPPQCHVRHLLSLDNNATKELINLDRENLPFAVTFVHDSDVLKFMRRVLADDLPFAWQSSEHLTGHFWAQHYPSISNFHEENTDFRNESSRHLVEADFGPKGIRSKLLQNCYEQGMPLSEIGRAEVEENGCGGGAFMYYSLRRPLFAFCSLHNSSSDPLRITGIRATLNYGDKLNPRPFAVIDSNGESFPITPIVLQPTDTLIVPTSVLLGPIEADDLRMDFSTYETISDEQGQSFGASLIAAEDTAVNDESHNSEYYQIGPSMDIRGFEVNSASGDAVVETHAFDPNQCYLWHRAWHVGSCPHVFMCDEHGRWHYLAEVLKDAWRSATVDEFLVPGDSQLMRIAEVEFESTTLLSVRLDGEEQLDGPIYLNQGEYVDFIVRGVTHVHLHGLYDCPIPGPQCPLHLRQKRSLVAAYAGSLSDSEDSHSSPKTLARPFRTPF